MGLEEVKVEWRNLNETLGKWKGGKKKPKKRKKCKKDKRGPLEVEIANAATTLKYYAPWSEEYSTASGNIERLANAQAELDEAKAKLHPITPKPKLDTNVVLTAAGSLAALGLVIWSQMDHEDGGLGLILPQKDLGFVPKIGKR